MKIQLTHKLSTDSDNDKLTVGELKSRGERQLYEHNSSLTL